MLEPVENSLKNLMENEKLTSGNFKFSGSEQKRKRHCIYVDHISSSSCNLVLDRGHVSSSWLLYINGRGLSPSVSRTMSICL